MKEVGDIETNHQSMPSLAIEKAEAAYRVMLPLSIAVTKFKSDPDLRFRCYDNLTIAEVDRSNLNDGIDLLAMDLGLSETSRTTIESGG